MLSINYYKLLFISSILLISYNSFAIDGCSADYSSGRVTIGDGNLIFNESCQVFSESTITLENDGNYRTILVGDATENLSVLIEASQLILEPDPNDILELIIEAQDTLVIIGDLRLFNNSTVTVKDNGVLIIHGSLLTEGDEDTPEKSSKVNINVAAEGQIHVNEDAILNYSSGNLEGLIIVPNGKIESYSIEGEVPGWLLGWLALCEWLFPDSQYTQDLSYNFV